MEAIELEFKQVTEEMLAKYLNLHEVIKVFEKDKEAIRKAILYVHPNGGKIGKYRINVKMENGRRSFDYDQAKALVTEESWDSLYVPFIKIGDPIRKLTIELNKK